MRHIVDKVILYLRVTLLAEYHDDGEDERHEKHYREYHRRYHESY